MENLLNALMVWGCKYKLLYKKESHEKGEKIPVNKILEMDIFSFLLKNLWM